jgi:tRNA modification GTPase
MKGKKMAADTIAAISTAAFPSAVSLVRLSGENAIEIADKLFEAKSGKKLSEIKGYSALYGSVFDKDGVFDSAVALVFRAPKSYTGENVVELTVHGGLYLTRRLLRATVEAGARLAQAGEFTRRAFLNGKMSLSQAESVAELISAEGMGQAKAALAATEGRINRESENIRQRIVTLLGQISAYCDYPDEDIVDVSRETLVNEITQISNQLAAMTDGFERGSVIKNGVDTAIVGSPNVGKSTIMNLLSGYEKSIVTSIAGTTRDIVEDTVRVGDFTLRLSDTAGIRETDDKVESVGVERARKRLESAALILAVFDGSRELSKDDLDLIDATADKNCVAVINKTDLEGRLDESKIVGRYHKTVKISAKNGEGADKLSDAIGEALDKYKLGSDALTLVNERQYDCVVRAKKEIDAALFAAKEGQHPDMLGILLEEALRALSELSGESATEAVVNEIFSKFCVGK